MRTRGESLGDGYLYSVWNGKLKEYRGVITYFAEIQGISYIEPERTYFDVLDARGIKVKTYNCASKEGEIHNKVVWLHEPNKQKAAEILIEYEEQQIAKLQMQIENHKELIELLKIEG